MRPAAPAVWLRDRDPVVTLARRFPTLRDADGLHPWNAERFYAWAFDCGGLRDAQTRHAVNFVLSVFGDGWWGPRHRRVTFDLFEAMRAWDKDHREAFASWARVPFWP